MADVAERRKRQGGRAAHAERKGHKAIDQMPWRIPINTDRPTEPLTEEGVAAIHDGAMRILEEIGIEFLNEEALALFREIGCTVEGTNVRMGRDWVMEMLRPRPVRVHDHAPQPRPHPPHRRQGDPLRQRLLAAELLGPRDRQGPGHAQVHCQNLLKLTQYFNCIHFAGGYPVEPVDIHPSVRHLDVLFDKLTHHRQGDARLFARQGAGRGRDGDGPHRGRAHRRRNSARRRGCTPTSTPPRRSSTTSR